jgi:hypothetical protein
MIATRRPSSARCCGRAIAWSPASSRSRPADRVDLAALLRVADQAELERAGKALALIHARGFSRGRDLMRALADATRDLGES